MTVIDADHQNPPHGAPASQMAAPANRFARLISSPWRLVPLLIAAVLVIDAGGTDEGAGVCVFRRCTGGYCPGCGMTRAARNLTRGEIGAAWQNHPIVVLLAIQAVIAAFIYAVARNLRARFRAPRTLAILAVVNGVLLLGIWVVRLVNGSIPRFF